MNSFNLPRNKIFGLKTVIGICLLFVFVSLQGCERSYHLKAHALEGYLHTPWGKFEFQRITSASQARDMQIRGWDSKWRAFLYADAGDVFVILPLNLQSTAFLGRKDSKYGYAQNYNLNIIASDTKILSKKGEFIGHALSHDINNQKFGKHGFRDYGGGGFIRSTGGRIGNPYRIVIPFNLSGDDFLVDVLVKATKDGYWELDIGVPAH